MTAVKSITPESLRPHPKAGPRKKNGGRKKGKTLILSDTPVKAQIEVELKNRVNNQKKKSLANVSRKRKESFKEEET